MTTLNANRQATLTRQKALDAYLTENVLNRDFVCPNYADCRASHPGTFYEGQLHHLGHFYDLELGKNPLRVVVVGQEYGHEPSRTRSQARYEMIMKTGLRRRFKKDGSGLEVRNPHMRGTTSLLRLLFGIPLGTDHESEFLAIGGKRVHIFNAFALVNYLLCSAVPSTGGRKGSATSTMKHNCRAHFRRVLEILAPSVVVVQGKGFWKSVRPVFDSATEVADNVQKGRLGTADTFIATFSHPSAHFPDNWGTNDHTEYLLHKVVPAVNYIRTQLQSEDWTTR